MDLKSYIEYEELVLVKLEEQISRTGKKAVRGYRKLIRGRVYIFDLVEINDNGDILKVYEVKSPRAVKSNLNFIKHQLEVYAELMGVSAFLVYLDDGELQIKSLLDLKDEPNENKENALKVIKNFSEFYEDIKDKCDKQSELQYFFRGHSNCKYKIIPSIYRGNSISNEDKMFYKAICSKPLEFTDDMTTFDKLVKMQHYELPTRLLDITTNPLVALYFACKEDDDHDGSVIIFSMPQDKIKNYNSDSVCILSNLSKCSIDFKFNEDKDHLVYDIQQDKPNFKGEYLEESAINNVLCVFPKLNNDRIIRQSGAFFIFGMGQSKTESAKFEDAPSIINIKADCKRDILEELQLLGIDEATLFPETDKAMKQIKLQYIKD